MVVMAHIVEYAHENRALFVVFVFAFHKVNDGCLHRGLCRQKSIERQSDDLADDKVFQNKIAVSLAVLAIENGVVDNREQLTARVEKLAIPLEKQNIGFRTALVFPILGDSDFVLIQHPPLVVIFALVRDAERWVGQHDVKFATLGN